jgi:hypothetical protein
MHGDEAGRYGREKLQLAHSIYAHELGHAIDGPRKEITGSKQWQEAYAAEIGQTDAERASRAEPKLSWYGGTRDSEGFAEFARLVHGSDVPHAQIERDFPLSTAVFKDRGLWPQRERTGPEGKMSEVFERAVEIPEVGSHADVLLKPAAPAQPAPSQAEIAKRITARRKEREAAAGRVSEHAPPTEEEFAAASGRGAEATTNNEPVALTDKDHVAAANIARNVAAGATPVGDLEGYLRSIPYHSLHDLYTKFGGTAATKISDPVAEPGASYKQSRTELAPFVAGELVKRASKPASPEPTPTPTDRGSLDSIREAAD